MSMKKAKDRLSKIQKSCQSCGREDELTVDHIKPKSLGGTNEILNLQLLCKTCNQRKANKYKGLKKVRLYKNGKVIKVIVTDDYEFVQVLNK